MVLFLLALMKQNIPPRNQISDIILQPRTAVHVLQTDMNNSKPPSNSYCNMKMSSCSAANTKYSENLKVNVSFSINCIVKVCTAWILLPFSKQMSAWGLLPLWKLR